MKIGPSDLSEKVFLVAEIGNNHEGNYDLAERMISEAAASGADAVKFQTIVPERLVSRDEIARRETLRKFQFTRSQFESLKCRADRESVQFLSTPFDLEAVAWLNELVPAFKIASGDNTFYPLIDAVAATGKPVILSTGLLDMSGAGEVRDYLLQKWSSLGTGDPGLALLHCVVSYPTPDTSAELRAIASLCQLENITPGYSDHTLGIDACILAVALGARIIEKHFTFDKARSTFRDHQLSADPADFRLMVDGIRRAERMIGQGTAAPLLDNAPHVRRSIAACRELHAGETVRMADLAWLRPASGFPPGCEEKVIGRRLAVTVGDGEIFHEGHFACVE